MTENNRIIEYLGDQVRPTGEVGDHLVRVKRHLRSIVALRAELLSMGLMLLARPGSRAVLVLHDTQISTDRLLLEFEAARASMKKNIADRLELLIFRAGEWTGAPGDPSPKWIGQVSALIADGTMKGKRLGRPDYFFEVLKLLILRSWDLESIFGDENQTATTRVWLMDAIGCSYPTVASALDRLGQYLIKHSDRSISLSRFPKVAFDELVLKADRVREPARFADRSGRPRSPEALVARLSKQAIPGLAISGTIGARFWAPDLDLHGDPRLDLVVHCPNAALDLSFVPRLDPALAPVAEPAEPASLVIHALRRKKSLFAPRRSNQVPVADPLECLLDLHELRLTQQANAFAKALALGRGQA
jgi:hypothetical protein